MNKRIVHDALILTAFTLVLGFILALVQGITAEPIDKANKAAAQKAYQAVFSDAKSFEKYDYDADEADKLAYACKRAKRKYASKGRAASYSGRTENLHKHLSGSPKYLEEDDN